MQVIAHRGCHKEAIENSWAALRKAVSYRCERVEIDLQWTRDKKDVLVMHDESLLRTVGVAAKTTHFSREELRQFTLLNGEPLPFFDELLSELLPEIEINAEIKGSDPSLALAAAKLLWQSPHRHRVIFSCFHPEPLLALAEHYPLLRRAVLWGEDTRRIRPFYYYFPLKFIQRVKANIFHPEASKLSAKLMQRLRARGITVFPWVPMRGEDEAHSRYALWEKMAALGVDGLCTNYPREFQEWLKKG